MRLTAYVLECISPSVVEVVVSPEFEAWYEALDETDSDAVQRVVDLLEVRGVTLPFPYSSALQGSRHALRELRVQSKGRPLRIAYGFDPKRQAVVLLGADKTGDDRFYEWFVPEAERLWERYLRENP
jgi:hypothetical protein